MSHSALHGRPRVPGVVWLLVSLHGLLLTFYALLMPAYIGPEEHRQADLVLRLEAGGRYPGPGTTTVSRQVLSSYRVQGDPADQNWPLAAAQAPARADRPAFDELPAGPSRDRNHMTQHPPLYYALSAVALRTATDLMAGAGGWAYDAVLAFCRLVSVALLTPLPLCAYLTARRLLGGDREPVALAAAALPLAVPMLTHVGSKISLDNLLTLLVACLTVYIVRVVRGDASWSTALRVGALTGLALLTKGFALVLPVWTATAYALAAWRSRTLRRWVGPALLAHGVAAGVGGWWWVRNLARYDEIQPRLGKLKSLPGVDPDYGFYASTFFNQLVKGFWFAPRGAGLPSGPLKVLTLIALTVVVVAFVRRHRSWSSRAELLLLLGPTLLIGALFAWASLGFYADTGRIRAIHGRYLFTGLAGSCVVAAVGLADLLRRRAALLPAAVMTLAVGLQAAAITRAMAVYWGLPGPDSPVTSFAALAAWSPWPPLVLWAVCAGIVAVTIVLAARLLPPPARGRPATPAENRRRTVTAPWSR